MNNPRKPYDGHLNPYMTLIRQRHKEGERVRKIAEEVYDLGARTAVGYYTLPRSRDSDISALIGLIRHALGLKRRGTKSPATIDGKGWAEAVFVDDVAPSHRGQGE